MLCILPQNASSDVALHIHITLIEAFCWENDIRVVKVSFALKLRLTLNNSSIYYLFVSFVNAAVIWLVFNASFCIKVKLQLIVQFVYVLWTGWQCREDREAA